MKYLRLYDTRTGVFSVNTLSRASYNITVSSQETSLFSSLVVERLFRATLLTAAAAAASTACSAVVRAAACAVVRAAAFAVVRASIATSSY